MHINNPHNLLRRIQLGIARRPRKFFASTFVSLALIWGWAEPLTTILGIDFRNYQTSNVILSYIAVSAIVAAFVVRLPDKVTLRIKNTNTTVRILFGDIFKQSGGIVVPVNEYFDTDINQLVSTLSVHGQFIKYHYSQPIEQLDKSITRELRDLSIGTVKKRGKKNRYPIGTTAVIKEMGKKYYLFALSNTDIKTGKASASPASLMFALQGLWKKVKISSNGEPVNLPLVGGGLSGIDLPCNHRINLILITILEFAKKEGFSNDVCIILMDDIFDEVDLTSIKQLYQ